MCSKILHKKRGHIHLNIVEENKTKKPIASPPSVSLPIHCTSKSHAYCFACKRPGPKLIVVPAQARFNVFIEKAIIVPAGSRCCPVHLDGKSLQVKP